jgi:hypothetical protein
VSETEPFTVRGRHFRPGERVKIVVQAKGRFEAQQAAGPDGSFAAVIPEVKFDECRGYVVKAEGSLGSRAAFKRQAAECGAPLAPPQKATACSIPARCRKHEGFRTVATLGPKPGGFKPASSLKADFLPEAKLV